MKQPIYDMRLREERDGSGRKVSPAEAIAQAMRADRRPEAEIRARVERLKETR